MIQRIQTIYLFLAAALAATFIFLPAATLFAPSAPVIFSPTGFYEAGTNHEMAATVPLAIVAALSALLPLINIFLYRNRPLQMRVCRTTTLLLLAVYIVFGIYVHTMSATLQSESTQWGASLTMPAVALILNEIALRRVRADERLVRSADRLR